MADTDEYFERLVDVEALGEFLTEELGPTDRYSVERHTGGNSNETLTVEWGDRTFIVRRPPPGETADTAHDVLREYEVMSALQDTDVPVPETVVGCEDHSVIGSDFYVMARVEGEVPRASAPKHLDDDAGRRGMGEQLVDTLAKIHAVDIEAVGLADFGYPEGYTERQVDRWQEQLSWAFEVTADEREVPGLDRVGDWLADNIPEDYPHTLVHGDYKHDNVIFGPEPPAEIAAVLDWEMSTLGDPFFDLGWMLSYWRDAKDPEPVLPELVTQFMEAEGFPTRQELVDRYEQRTGLSYDNDRFYRTLAVYKLAGLGEMFFRRHIEGNADNPMYPKMRERVPALADRAERIIDGEEPL
jgi:aminoglycoside phosphotransferase (APT) family kinase protein